MPEYSEYPAFSDPYFLIYKHIPTGQKMKFSINDFFSKCDQSHRNLRVWSNFLKKSLMESFIFCAVTIPPLNKKIWLIGNLYSGIFYAMIYEPEFNFLLCLLKGALSSLRQFLTTESPLKMMKNAFNFILKAILFIKIF